MYASRTLRTVGLSGFHKNVGVLGRLNCPRHVFLAGPRFVSSVDRESPFKNTFVGRVLNKIPFVNVNRSQIVASAFVLYENSVDQINYMDFFELLDLPDSFYSWFVVTELHLWMICVRAMAEGEDGKLLRNYVIRALWNDVTQRSKKIGSVNLSVRNRQVNELSEQLQAALIAYDEGLQSDDVVLAAALWRRLYQREYAEPKHLDILVRYVRREIRMLDRLTSEDLFINKKIPWQSLNKIIKTT